jgi:hypothetical protein
MARRRYREEGYEGGGGGYGGGYGYRGGAYRRRERRVEERRIELASFAAIILLFMVGLLYHIDAKWLSTIGGAILVGSAIYQTQRRWRVSPITWIGGAILLIVGLFALNGQPVPGGIFLPLGVFAGVIIYSALTGEL